MKEWMALQVLAFIGLLLVIAGGLLAHAAITKALEIVLKDL